MPLPVYRCRGFQQFNCRKEDNSVGVPTGNATITCKVTDERGQTATADTSVTILAPYVPPVPHTQALAAIRFDKDKKRLARVDNEAKAVLDEIALELGKQSDAKLVVVGDASAEELIAKPQKAHRHAKAVAETAENLAAERAVNTKQYLVADKGIDPNRIAVATGKADDHKAENYLVPFGANFAADVAGTTLVDEAAVKPEVRKPLPERHGHKKPAKKSAA
jgi:outer membrane protein OmpA-like peptidoglycan-associated protein